MYDLIIRNATVINGDGEAGFVADVGVARGEIVEIATHIPVRAKEEVAAEGLLLTPGFIDVQNHSDSYWCLFDSPELEASLLQGFTSVLVGHCGTSLAPLLSRDALKSSQKWHDLSGTNFNWTSFAEFAATLAKQQFGVNVGSLVGYSTLRRGLLGDEQRSVTEDEMAALSAALRESLASGAFGLSTGLSYTHESNVSELELYELAKIVQSFNGLLSVHLRSESAALAESVEEAVEIARRSHARVKLSHFKLRDKTNWPALPEILQRLEDVVHSGVDLSFDVYPYASTWQPLYTYLPKWATGGGREAMLKLLADPIQAKKVLAYLHSSDVRVQDLVVASTSFNMKVVSKSFGQIAQNLGLSSEEALLEVLRHGGSEVLVFDQCLDEDQVEKLLAHPLSVVASDGGGFNRHATQHGQSKLVHPRCFGTSAQFLSRMKKSSRISFEMAIAKLTSLPARVWGLSNRGQIAVGFAADLVLLDPSHIADAATMSNPRKSPKGIRAVWVNGMLAAENGEPTGVHVGGFLRRS